MAGMLRRDTKYKERQELQFVQYPQVISLKINTLNTRLHQKQRSIDGGIGVGEGLEMESFG